MSRSAKLTAFPKLPKHKLDKKNGSNDPTDVSVLALEIQTLTLLVNDLRGRVAELEQQIHQGEITPADRARLSKLDDVFHQHRPPVPIEPDRIEPSSVPTMVPEASPAALVLKLERAAGALSSAASASATPRGVAAIEPDPDQP
jgi:hypothetical protein